MRLMVMMEPCEEGGFHVWVPALPGCHSEGDTEEEAMRGLREAIRLYLEPNEENLPGPPAWRIEIELESGGVPLEQALQQVETHLRLKKQCEELLAEVQAKTEELAEQSEQE